MGTTQDLNKRNVPLFIAGSDVQDRHARGYEIEFTANVIKGLRMMAACRCPMLRLECVSAHARLRRKEHGQLKLIAQDAGAKIDASNVATVDTAIPANTRPDAQAAADAYNTIFTAYRNLNINRSTGVNQPLYKFFGDYTVQGGRFKGVRLGAGVQYRGREIIGNRGADTIVIRTIPRGPSTIQRAALTRRFTRRR